MKIGDPLKAGTADSVRRFKLGIKEIKEQGGRMLVGGAVITGPGNFVEPTIAEIKHDAEVVQKEIFAPIMHMIKFSASKSSLS